MKERILEFLRYENKTSAQFAEEIGVQASSISHIISGRNNPSLDFVMKMLQKYPALSTDWLLFGSGGMFKEHRVSELFDGSRQDDNLSKTIPERHLKSSSGDPKLNESNESTTLPGKSSFKIHGTAKRIFVINDDDTFKEYMPGE